MSLRKIHTETGLNKVANVYRDSEYDEYRVIFYRYGQRVKGADYHTNDKQDAIDTGKNWINNEIKLV